uniref:C2H2-type domain-containing protein n=1 Tax=Phlebotomus papatasi TaxID=29031 RepID=A0A1B0DNG0_PHLPP
MDIESQQDKEDDFFEYSIVKEEWTIQEGTEQFPDDNKNLLEDIKETEEVPYLVTELGEETNLVEYQRALVDDHFSRSITEKHKCNICGKTFLIFSDLQAHLRNHDSLLRTFQCLECQETFTSRHSLHDHVQEIHSKDILPCHICGKFFRGKKLLNNHIKRHDTQYTCGICGKAFWSSISVQFHIKREHRVHNKEDTTTSSDLTEVKCLYCDKDFLKSDLKYHVWELHTGLPVNISDGPISPKFCSVVLPQMNLVNFIKKRIPKPPLGKIWRCPICRHTFSDQETLKTHAMTIHSHIIIFPKSLNTKTKNQGTFACKICKRMFIKQKYLQTHVRNIHAIEKDYQCAHCPKAFSFRYQIVRHLRDVHSSRELPCDRCDKAFKSLEGLNRHIARHEKKPFHCNQCKTCKSTFSQRWKYELHLLEHKKLLMKSVKPEPPKSFIIVDMRTPQILPQFTVLSSPNLNEIPNNTINSETRTYYAYPTISNNNPTIPAIPNTLPKFVQCDKPSQPSKVATFGKSIQIKPIQGFKCPICGKVYVEKQEIVDHVMYQHSGITRKYKRKKSTKTTKTTKTDIIEID